MNIITDLDNSSEKIIMLPNNLKKPHIFLWKHAGLATAIYIE